MCDPEKAIHSVMMERRYLQDPGGGSVLTILVLPVYSTGSLPAGNGEADPQVLSSAVLQSDTALWSSSVAAEFVYLFLL